jgi:Peptidase family M48
MLAGGMRSAVAVYLAFGSCGAICQVPSRDTSTQAGKQWELGRPTDESRETRDGIINDPAIVEYLQQLAGRVTSANSQPIQVRITRSRDQYAILLANRVLYISAGLLETIENEAELAGLLAHELAHRLSPSGCVLGSTLASSRSGDPRAREQEATTDAILSLKAIGYDPVEFLGLLSKLAYEHPVWAKAIVLEDLIDFRVRLEGETAPVVGYRIDSSAFRRAHSALEAVLGKSTATHVVASGPIMKKR